MRTYGDASHNVPHRGKLVAPAQDFDPICMAALLHRLRVRLTAGTTIVIEGDHKRLCSLMDLNTP